MGRLRKVVYMMFAHRLRFAVISFLLVFCLIVYTGLLRSASSIGHWKEVKIPNGSTYLQALNVLEKEGLIRNKFMLVIFGKLTGTEKKIKAGYYNLNPDMSPLEIFNILRNGKIIEYSITIPEGATLEEIILRLAEKGFAEDDLYQIVKAEDLLYNLDVDAPSLEGYLYPDTYNLPKGMRPEEILKMMVARLRKNLNQDLMERAKALGFSEREVLTLASIIEREAKFDEERSLISAVYHNRLRKNMPLQADPTAIYGVKKMGEKITKKDLKRYTPYNTYKIRGLPPGPIASPGIKSIRAALYPADVDYLYFVSQNDGSHFFSTELSEHANAVRTYQLNPGREKSRN
ncbi:MAG: endolytic transglycosylase MltG [Nitrospirae bacterium]|nr:endolytic transglycosylase MltG [Nitrospirota bacterium]